MLKVFDYVCPEGHTTEVFKSDPPNTIECPVCHQDAVRQLAAPRSRLEGVTGAFPGAAMQWEKKREQKLAIERKKAADHGDDGWT